LFYPHRVFHEGSTCKASDFKDQGMCSYLHFGGTTEKYEEDVRQGLELTYFPIWKKLFM